MHDYHASGIVDRNTNPQPDKAAFAQKTRKLQMPFIANNGQVDEQVKFYAKTFGGTVFVTKDGEIVYSLPKSENSGDRSQVGEGLPRPYRGQKSESNPKSQIKPVGWVEQGETQQADSVETQCLASLMHSPNEISPLERGDKGVCNTTPILNNKNETHPQPLLLEGRTGIALREEFVGARVKAIQGEDPSVTKVNYFKGSDPEKWKTNVSTYNLVNLGEIYDGIELKLKAYGNNVEKLFCINTGADPEKIKIGLNGIRSLKVNKEGLLEVETELGTVKFTKPVAYQEIDGKRVYVDVAYCVQRQEAGGKRREVVAEGQGGKGAEENSKLETTKSKTCGERSRTIVNHKCTYSFKVASYDKSKDLIIDPLLASTYLGGSSEDYGNSLTLDTSGNVYVTGYTRSTDFPTTSGAYDTSYNGGGRDVFVSKLDGNLSASATTPTPTPTSGCEVSEITLSENKLTLNVGKSEDVTVTLTGKDGCIPNGVTIKTEINTAGRKRISVSPESAEANDSGETTFIITAKKKGSALLTFKSNGMKKKLMVKVKK